MKYSENFVIEIFESLSAVSSSLLSENDKKIVKEYCESTLNH